MCWSVLFEGIISSVGTEWYDQDGFECDTYSLNTTTLSYGHTCSTHLFKPDSAPEVTAGAWYAGGSGCLAWGAWAWTLCFASASLVFHADLIDSALASTLSLAYLTNLRCQTYSVDIHSISYTNQNLLHHRFMICVGLVVSEPHNLPSLAITIPIEFDNSLIVLFSWLFDA